LENSLNRVKIPREELLPARCTQKWVLFPVPRIQGLLEKNFQTLGNSLGLNLRTKYQRKWEPPHPNLGKLGGPEFVETQGFNG